MAAQRLRLRHCLSYVGASNGDVAGQKSCWKASDGGQKTI